MSKRQSLHGKSVLITGAARGIGEQVARDCAAKGARVALVGLEPERLEALATELGSQHVVFAADVTSDEQMEAAVEGTVAELGGIDVVLANAGIASSGTVAITPMGVLAKTIEVNLVGVMRTVKLALPHVVRRRGYVQVVSSMGAFSGLPGMANYCAAKAGVEHFANILRLEVDHLGVQVGTVHPAWIETDMVRDQRDGLKVFSEAIDQLPGPAGRYTSLEECAGAIVDGMERRRRRVYVPRSVGVMAWAKPLVYSAAGDWIVRRRARKLVPAFEREVLDTQGFYGASSVERAAADAERAAAA